MQKGLFELKMNLTHIYCGNGKGKTTAAIGLTIRAVGSGMKVLFVQFFKNSHSSEIKILKNISNIDYMSPSKVFGRYKNMNDEQREETKTIYNNLLMEVIEKSKNYDMIILDEVISTYNYEMIDKIVLLDWVKNKSCEIVLTGRNPADELIEIADYVSEVKKIKHPYEKGIHARKGIEF